MLLCRWNKLPLLTRSTPHLGQVALCLSRLLAQLHHVPAQRLRGNGHLGKMLVIVTEVHCQEHLEVKREDGGREEGERGILDREEINNTKWRVLMALVEAEGTQ